MFEMGYASPHIQYNRDKERYKGHLIVEGNVCFLRWELYLTHMVPPETCRRLWAVLWCPAVFMR